MQFERNRTRPQWFTMIGPIDHTRYFHINLQSAELILIRPLEELMNDTTIIELRINVTNDWIHMYTVQVNLVFFTVSINFFSLFCR